MFIKSCRCVGVRECVCALASMFYFVSRKQTVSGTTIIVYICHMSLCQPLINAEWIPSIPGFLLNPWTPTPRAHFKKLKCIEHLRVVYILIVLPIIYHRQSKASIVHQVVPTPSGCVQGSCSHKGSRSTHFVYPRSSCPYPTVLVCADAANAFLVTQPRLRGLRSQYLTHPPWVNTWKVDKAMWRGGWMGGWRGGQMTTRIPTPASQSLIWLQRGFAHSRSGTASKHLSGSAGFFSFFLMEFTLYLL